MATNFSSLRSARQNAIEKLRQEMDKENRSNNDERFWKLTVDPKTKLGYAVIRFLPAPVNEEVPWVHYYSHNFQISGKWFIENCPTTMGVTCPVCRDNNRLWQTGIEADKKIASARKRKQSYISNILVVNDSAHPENNGKVFLFRYGIKLFEKIQEYINPKFPDQQPGNPFDMWTGADFKLKSVPQGDFISYDKSEFAAISELFPNDDTQKEKKLWSQEHALQPFVDAKQFKSFDDLEKRFVAVLTGADKPAKTVEDAVKGEQPTVADAKVVAEAIEKPVTKRKKPTPAVVATEDEDLKDYFADVLEDE